jgi:hypothetical protein
LHFIVTLNIDTTEHSLEHIYKSFVKTILPFFEKYVCAYLSDLAQIKMNNGEIAKQIGCSMVTWKTSTGNETTTIQTPLGPITLPQLQIKTDTGKRLFITRMLLGVEPRKRIPWFTKKYIALMGALAPLRIVNKFFEMFTGTRTTLMTIVRSIREVGASITFDVDNNETNEFEADGTGMPILGVGKRGKELCVLAQRKIGKGIRIAGMTLAAYSKGWVKLFEPLKESLKRFGHIFLTTDGDTSPLNGLDGVEVILQRCLFHIVHEAKYTLWLDRVKRKGRVWKNMLAKLIEITNIKRVRDDPSIARRLIKWKRNQTTRLINYCKRRGYDKTAKHLENAKQDLFKGIEKRISGGTTSYVERVMRTVNQRINVGQWSDASALSVSKIRGAYYYNHFDV